jgi:hypothetical protein
MFSDFVGRNAIFIGLLLLAAGAGVVLGLVGRAGQQRSLAPGVAALLCALVCVGVGAAQRGALVDASAFVATVPGLSRADRERIVADDLSDAAYALEFALATALLPLIAGGRAVVRVLRTRRT